MRVESHTVPAKGQRAGIENNEKTDSEFNERGESRRWRCICKGETKGVLHGVYECGG